MPHRDRQPSKSSAKATSSQRAAAARGRRLRSVPGRTLGALLGALAALWAVSGPSAAQTLQLEAPAQLAWQSRFDVSVPAKDVALASASDGGLIYATGYSIAGAPQLRTVAFDSASSTTLWDHTFGAGSDAETIGLGISAAPGSGRVFVRGAVRPAPGLRLKGGLVAYSAASGQVLWNRTLTSGASSSYDERVTALAVSADGARVFVTVGADPDALGIFPAGAPNMPARLMALNAATGATLWEQALVNTQGARQLLLSADQTRLFVTGAAYVGNVYTGISSITTAEARQATNGALLWQRLLGTSSPGLVGGRDLALSADGQTLHVCAEHAAVQVTALATGNGATQWSFGQPGFGAWRGLGLPQGGLAVAGRLSSDLAVKRLNTAGAPIWEQAYPENATPVRLLSDAAGGRLLLSGVSWFAVQDGQRSVRALDPTSGALLWSRSVGLGNGAQELGGDLALLPGDELASVGSLYQPTTDQSFQIERLRLSDGALLAVQAYDGQTSSDQSVVDMQLSSAGDRLISIGSAGEKLGLSTPSWNPKQGWIQAQSSATGQSLWSHNFPQTGTAPTAPTALRVDAGGSQVFVAGSQDGERHFTAALDAGTGALQWQVTDDLWPNTPEQVYDLASGGPFVFASTFNPSVYQVSARNKQTGALVWRYTSPPADLASTPKLISSPDGTRLYLIGASQGQQGSFTDVLVVCLDAQSGGPVWVQQFDPTGQQEFWDHDDVAAAALSADGSGLFLVGISTANAQFQSAYLCVRLDALTGQVQWHNQVLRPGIQNLYPRDLALAPDGSRLYVVGMEVLSPMFPSLRGLTVLGLEAASGQVVFEQGLESGFDLDATDLRIDADGSKGYALGWLANDSWNQEVRFTAFDGQSGARLWGGSLTSPVGTPEHARRGLQSADGERLWIAAQSGGPGSYRDLTVLAIDLPELTAFPGSLSLSAGGSQQFDLSGHGAQGNAVALLLGSLSGTSPGLPLTTGLLPLNPDAYFTLTLTAPNQPPLSGSLGLLSPSGHREASLNLPPGTLPALAGATLHHAWVALQGADISLISNPVPLALLP